MGNWDSPRMDGDRMRHVVGHNSVVSCGHGEDNVSVDPRSFVGMHRACVGVELRLSMEERGICWFDVVGGNGVHRHKGKLGVVGHAEVDVRWRAVRTATRSW